MPIRELYCRMRVIGASDLAAIPTNDRIAPIPISDCQHFSYPPGLALNPSVSEPRLIAAHPGDLADTLGHPACLEIYFAVGFTNIRQPGERH